MRFHIPKEFPHQKPKKFYFNMSTYIDSISLIKKKLLSKNIKKVLIISGQNSYYKTGAKKIFENLLINKKKFFFIKKSNIPDFNELVKIINFKELINPDLIIAIGGGCVIDYAKICRVFNKNKNLKNKIINSDFFDEKRIKLLAIPTTAGSGAEVTSSAAIYIKNIKYSVEGSILKPDFYCLIPKLFLSSSQKIDASSGFDAISQSIESILSKKSTKQSVDLSKNPIKKKFDNFYDFLKNKNLSNSYKMALGANLSGKAISISKTTAPHALSYPFTAHFKVPHGHAVSLTLNKFLKFNYLNLNESKSSFNLKKRFEILFNLTKSRNLYELDHFILELKKKALLEQDFLKLGIHINRDIHKIVNGINDKRLSNNPVKVLKKDIRYIIENF